MAHQTELHLASFLPPWRQEKLYSFLRADQRDRQREQQTEWEDKERRGYVQRNVQQHPAQEREIMGQMAGGSEEKRQRAERSESEEGGETSTTSCERTWHKRAEWRVSSESQGRPTVLKKR